MRLSDYTPDSEKRRSKRKKPVLGYFRAPIKKGPKHSSPVGSKPQKPSYKAAPSADKSPAGGDAYPRRDNRARAEADKQCAAKPAMNSAFKATERAQYRASYSRKADEQETSKRASFAGIVAAIKNIARKGEKTQAPFAVKSREARARTAAQWLLDKKESIYVGVGAGLCLIVLSCVFIPMALNPKTKDVVINDNGFKVSVSTEDETVGELISSTGVSIGEHDAIDYNLHDNIEDGMEIAIRRAMQVNVESGNDKKEVFLLTGTVGEALDMAGVSLGEYDEVYPMVDEYTTPGMTITHILVEKEIITTTEKIGYKEVTEKNSKLKKGVKRTAVEGKEGVRENTIEVTYKNGIETSREKLSSEVVQKPVNKVIQIGTMPEPTPKPTKKPADSKEPSATKKPADSGGSEEGSLTKAPSVSEIYSDTLSEHKSKPAPDSSIIDRVLIANNVTAYTHTGNRTASGTWPRIGTVACYFGALPKNTKIYVPGYGYGRVEDQGSGRDSSVINLDLFMETQAQCTSWGRKTNWEFYVLK